MRKNIESSVSLWLDELLSCQIETATLRIDDVRFVAKLTYDEHGQDIKIQASAKYALSEETATFGLYEDKKKQEFLTRANNLYNESQEMIGEEEMFMFLDDISAEFENNNECRVRLSNGLNDIIVKTNVAVDGTTFKWHIDGQGFDDSYSAKEYLEQLIFEKVSGVRVILHKRLSIPEICGKDGIECRAPNCDEPFCVNCPLAEEFFAKRDKVILKYAIKDEALGYF